MITKKTIEAAGFADVEELTNNIFYIKSFLSAEELDFAKALIAPLSEGSWALVNDGLPENWQNKFYDHNDGALNGSIRKKMAKVLETLPDLQVIGYNRFLRQSPGQNMDAHIDERNDVNNGSTREYAAVIYVNDDYEGGEIRYVNLDISVKPEAGSMLIFKTGPEYLHEVLQVRGNNSRYCLPGFFFSSWKDIE